MEDVDEYTIKVHYPEIYMSFHEFTKQLHTKDDTSIFASLFQSETMETYGLTSANTRIVLSFGGGSSVKQAFFPNIFADTNINPPQDDSSETTFLFLIAFDETFRDVKIVNAFRQSIIGHIRKLKPNQLHIEVYTACICENIPICNDKTIVRYNTYMLQTLPDATFDDMKPCDVDGAFTEQFTHLLHDINRHDLKVYIHNDAWFDTTLPFGTNVKVKRVPRFGSNFELLRVIPALFSTHFTKPNVFLIRGSRDESHATIVLFFSHDAITKYMADFTNADNATLVGLTGAGRTRRRRRIIHRKQSRHRRGRRA
jgi:hypothetical protein